MLVDRRAALVSDPTIYASLLDKALLRPLPEWREAVERISAGYALSLADAGTEQLRKAYVAGVCDGFAQGVAAEAERAASQKTDAT